MSKTETKQSLCLIILCRLWTHKKLTSQTFPLEVCMEEIFVSDVRRAEVTVGMKLVFLAATRQLIAI